MALTPPKCKTCGKIEYRHVCSGAALITERTMKAPARPITKTKRPAKRKAKK
jgi:hypothetical protein